MYILSGENITAVYTMSRRRWDQNTTQVDNRLDWAGATYVRLLHIPPWIQIRAYSTLTAARRSTVFQMKEIKVDDNNVTFPVNHRLYLTWWPPLAAYDL